MGLSAVTSRILFALFVVGALIFFTGCAQKNVPETPVAQAPEYITNDTLRAAYNERFEADIAVVEQDKHSEKQNIIAQERGAKIELRGVKNPRAIKAIAVRPRPSELASDVAVVTDAQVEQARIRLPVYEPIKGIARCDDYNPDTDACSAWTETNIPYTLNGNFVEFTVDHFTGYGAIPKFEKLYVQSAANAAADTTAAVNLATAQDGTQNSVAETLATGTLAVAANTTMTATEARIIRPGDQINFTSYWTTGSRITSARATFKLFAGTNGGMLVCQHGDDNSGGVALPAANTGTPTLVKGNCTVSANFTINQSSTVYYVIDVYGVTIGGGGSQATRQVTLFWDSAVADTWVRIESVQTIDVTLSTNQTTYKKGETLNASGTLSYFNGSAVAGKVVNVSFYNSTGALKQTRNVTTASNGFYNNTYNLSSTAEEGTWKVNVTGYYNTTVYAINETTFTVDTIAPVTSTVQASANATAANITWTTSQSANSSVQYGTTTSLASGSNSSAAYVTSQTLMLYGLQPNKQYFYNTTSCDSAGNCNTTGTYTFTTASYANMSACGSLGTANLEYRLTSNLDSENCLGVIADNITIDGRGFTVNASSTAINVSNVRNFSIKNLRIENSSINVYLKNVSGGVMTNLTVLNATNNLYFDTVSNYTVNNISENGYGIGDGYSGTGLGLYITASYNVTIANSTLINNTAQDVAISAASTTECMHTVQNVTGSGNLPVIFVSSVTRVANLTAAQFSLCNAPNTVVTNISLPYVGVSHRGLYWQYSANVTVDNISINRRIDGIRIGLSSDNSTIRNAIIENSSNAALWIGAGNVTVYNLSTRNTTGYGFIIDAASTAGSAVIGYTSFNESLGTYIATRNVLLANATISNISFVSLQESNITLWNVSIHNYSSFTFGASRENISIVDSYLDKYSFSNPGAQIIVTKSGTGTIAFLNRTNGSGANFSTDIRISANNVTVNSTQTGLNKSANITLYNMPGNIYKPYIDKEGVLCSDCANFTDLNATTVQFNTSSWSSLSIQATPYTQASSPANETVVDRDETQADPDVIRLNVTTNKNDGTTVTFKANLTAPSGIAGQANLVLGTNTTGGGSAVLFFNPSNATYYAGNYTWWGEIAGGDTIESRTFSIKGSYSIVFNSSTQNPNTTYLQNESLVLAVSPLSERPQYIGEYHAGAATATITNSTGGSTLDAMGYVLGSNQFRTILPVPLLDLKGVGVWNVSVASSADYFYIPTTINRTFTVYGFMNITTNTTTPASPDVGEQILTVCRVQDQHTDYSVAGTTVSFYLDGVLLGANTTNNTGYAQYAYSVAATGAHTISCNVTNDLSNYYYSGDEPGRTMAFTAVDTTPPVISNIVVTDITETSAVVSWTTDDASDSTVNYGTTTPPGNSIVNPTEVTAHEILLSGLTQDTTYHYNVSSCNAAALCADSVVAVFRTRAQDTAQPIERGFCTAVLVERGENYREGYISKGDVVEFYCEMPHAVHEREPVTFTLTNKNKQLRERVLSPSKIYASEVVLYP